MSAKVNVDAKGLRPYQTPRRPHAPDCYLTDPVIPGISWKFLSYVVLGTELRKVTRQHVTT